MPLLPGVTLVARYRVVRVIKSGGMGAVYEAKDGHLDDSPCALKEMLEQHLGTEDEALIERKFREEKALLAQLKHPGIPGVRDYFRLGGLSYIVMDYIQGANLEQELLDSIGLTGQPLAAETVVQLAVEVLDVLVYLHGHDPAIIHRDIKPANLIRHFRTGKVMLVDFGLARRLDVASTQTTIGTLGFCPMEQIQGHAEPRSDLYSLGITMHSLLSGLVPRPLGVSPLREVSPGVDPALAALVDRACATSPEGRFENARLMSEALVTWQTRPRRAHEPPVPVAPPPAPVLVSPTRRVFASGLVGLLALGLGYLMGRTPASGPSPAGQSPPFRPPSGGKPGARPTVPRETSLAVVSESPQPGPAIVPQTPLGLDSPPPSPRPKFQPRPQLTPRPVASIPQLKTSTAVPEPRAYPTALPRTRTQPLSSADPPGESYENLEFGVRFVVPSGFVPVPEVVQGRTRFDRESPGLKETILLHLQRGPEPSSRVEQEVLAILSPWGQRSPLRGSVPNGLPHFQGFEVGSLGADRGGYEFLRVRPGPGGTGHELIVIVLAFEGRPPRGRRAEVEDWMRTVQVSDP